MSGVRLTYKQTEMLDLIGQSGTRVVWTQYKPIVKLSQLGLVQRRQPIRVHESHASYEITPAGRAWLERNKA